VEFSAMEWGFALWDEMPSGLRQPVLQMARNAAVRYPEEVLRVAERRGRQELVCSAAKLAIMSACQSRRTGL
jgi:hypothetical protein